MRETTSSNPKDDPECARLLPAHCVGSTATADQDKRREQVAPASPSSDEDDTGDDVACPDCVPRNAATAQPVGGGPTRVNIPASADCPLCAVNGTRPSQTVAPTESSTEPTGTSSAGSAVETSSGGGAVEGASSDGTTASDGTSTIPPSDSATSRDQGGGTASSSEGEAAATTSTNAGTQPHSASDGQEPAQPSQGTSSARGDAKNNNKKEKRNSKNGKKTKKNHGEEDGSKGAEEGAGGRKYGQRQPPGRKAGGRRKSLLEYDIEDMYPEMEVLTQKRRHEWNFLDERVIRAMWLETKTNVLAGWKERVAKGRRPKKPPAVEVRLNHAVELRFDYRQRQLEQQEEKQRHEERLRVGNERPNFGPVTMATNTTAVLRHQYNRNEPPVPSRYLRHYDKYRRPPFNVFAVKRCGPIYNGAR